MRKVGIICGILCLITGIVMCIIALYKVDFDLEELNATNDYTEKSATFDNKDIIRLDLEVSILNIKVGTDDKIKINYFEDDYRTYTITDTDELLIKENYSDRPWYFSNFQLFYYPKTDMTISVPSDFTGEVIVYSNVGNIVIDKLDCKIIKLTAKTSNINLKNIKASDIEINTTTGNVNLSNIAVDDLKVKCTTGLITLKGVTTSTLNVMATTGNISLTNVVADDIKCSTTTGGAVFSYLEASDIEIIVTTGIIRGSVVGQKIDYTITASTTTGGTNVTTGGTGSKRLFLRATTGNIKISWVNKQ